MTKKLRYHGFRFCNSIAADNRQYYQDLLKERPWDKKVQKAIEFYNLIEPGKPYTRLLAHKVAVYKVGKPLWNSQGRFSVPRGELETIIEVDLGVEFMAAITGVKEIVIEEKAEHYFPDGSIIRGVRTKLVPGESQLEKLEDFLEIQHDLEDRKRKEGEFVYNFGIKKEAIDLANPLEIHIEEYMKLNGVLLYPPRRDNALIARYEPRKVFPDFGTHAIQLPQHSKFIYRKTSPNLIPNAIKN